MKRSLFLLLGLSLFLFVTSCSTQQPVSPEQNQPQQNISLQKSSQSDVEAELTSFIDGVNASLATSGADYRIAMVEYVTDGADYAGNTVLAKDVGNKQLSFDFVPNDPRRAGWSGPAGGSSDNITYAIDQTGDAVPVFGGLTAAETDAAIERATDTWTDANCSNLPLDRNPDFGLDIGLVAFQISGGAVGSPFVFADVQHAGWRDLNFGGGVLGATFTFRFIDGAGNSTDIDNNGVFDAAFREIYYDPSFSWSDDGVSNIDVETVAVHEIGHGLSQAHFGTIKLKNDGSLKASPRAVMNALYAGPFRDLAGTDNGGHCSNWASWPNN